MEHFKHLHFLLGPASNSLVPEEESLFKRIGVKEKYKGGSWSNRME